MIIAGTRGDLKKGKAPRYVYFRSRRGLEVEDAPPRTEEVAEEMPDRLIPRPETWNGDDLFGIAGVGWTSLFVSRRFVDAARANHWNFLAFSAMDLPRRLREDARFHTGGNVWPPPWYPEGVDPHPANTGAPPELPPQTPASGPPGDEPAAGGAAPEPGEEDEAGEDDSTGFTLLGAPVLWGFSSSEVDPELAPAVEYIRSRILPHLEAALKIARDHIIAWENDGKSEVSGVTVEISGEPSPEEDRGFLWELHVSTSGTHFLVFRDAALVGDSAEF